MTIDDQINILQSFKDGKKVEFRRSDKADWIRVPSQAEPLFDFQNVDYRIAPDPFECWVVKYPDGSANMVFNQDKAEHYASNSEGAIIHHMREIL